MTEVSKVFADNGKCIAIFTKFMVLPRVHPSSPLPNLLKRKKEQWGKRGFYISTFEKTISNIKIIDSLLPRIRASSARDLKQ
jgi:hypothetical protein